MNKDLLAKNLGIENSAVSILPPKANTQVKTVKIEPVENEVHKDIKEDYDKIRETLHEIMDEGVRAVRDARAIASTNELAESFNSVAQLIKAISNTTKDLYDIHEKTRNLKTVGKDEPGKKVLDDGNINIEKAVFVGTPTELLRQMKSKE